MIKIRERWSKNLSEPETDQEVDEGVALREDKSVREVVKEG